MGAGMGYGRGRAGIGARQHDQAWGHAGAMPEHYRTSTFRTNRTASPLYGERLGWPGLTTGQSKPKLAIPSVSSAASANKQKGVPDKD